MLKGDEKMNKLKNMLYDTNDILVAMLILCCAALVIATRVNAIMTYPERIAFDQRTRISSTQDSGSSVNVVLVYNDDVATSELPFDEDVDGGTLEGAMLPNDGNDATPATPHSAFTLYIEYGESMNQVGRDLVALGLFEDTPDFFSYLNNHNAASKVQSGNFVIPADSTKDDIIRIITGRN